MTDGIIQQTFKNLLGRSRYLSYEDDGNDDRYVNTDFIKEAEQELIEKIKQEFPKCSCDACIAKLRTLHDNERNRFLKKLIGDNNE